MTHNVCISYLSDLLCLPRTLQLKHTQFRRKKTFLLLNTNTSLRSWYQLVSLRAGGQCRGSPESRSFFQSRSQAQVVSFWTSHKPPSPSPLRRASLVSREDKPHAQSSGSAPLPSPLLCTPASLSATSTWYFARSPDDKTVLNKILAPTRCTYPPLFRWNLTVQDSRRVGCKSAVPEMTTWEQELLVETHWKL